MVEITPKTIFFLFLAYLVLGAIMVFSVQRSVPTDTESLKSFTGDAVKAPLKWVVDWTKTITI